MSFLYITEAEVAAHVDMPTAITAVEQAFRKLAENEASNVPRVRAQGKAMILHSMSATADYLGLVGWKQYTTTKAGAKFLVGLHDVTTGELVALIEANRLGQLRTGAVTGLAAKLLAKPGTMEMGLFGTGFQAQTQLAAVATAIPLRRAIVFGRSEVRRREFAERMSQELGIEVVPATEPRKAVEHLPLVVTATNSREPVFDGHWLAEGALVCAVGSNWLNKAEIDVTAVSRAETVVCDSIAACQHEAGDFTAALSQGSFDWSKALEFSDIVAGRKPGRASPTGIVLFKSVGLAIEDVALGAEVLRLAKERGLGTSLLA